MKFKIFHLFIFSTLLFFLDPLKITAQKFFIQDEIYIQMNKIPGTSFSISSTEITQEVYEAVTGENPSCNYRSETSCPVDSVNWYDAIVFCNRLSMLLKLTPVYSVNKSTNPDKWEYEAHSGQSITSGKVVFNKEADGFRLPTKDEWEKAFYSGTKTKALTHDTINKNGWYLKNSDNTPHPVAQKEMDKNGLYDMSGNVWEWCWDNYNGNDHYRIYKGGSCTSDLKLCQPSFTGHQYPSRYSMNYSYWWFGIRVVKNER